MKEDAADVIADRTVNEDGEMTDDTVGKDKQFCVPLTDDNDCGIS